MLIFLKNHKYFVIGVTCFVMLFNFFSVQAVEGKEIFTNAKEELRIQMITVEFKTKTEDGKEIESYRWDPGTVYVPKGEDVTLSIFGVNGKSHPFYIEGTNIKGEVKKGEETIVKLRFEEEGVFRIVCTAHETIEQNGPMVGYIVVK